MDLQRDERSPAEEIPFLVDGRLETFGTSNCLRSFAYTYDSHGNWIKAVETQLSDPDEPASEREVIAITYRVIGYR